MTALTIYPLSASTPDQKNQERAGQQGGSLAGGFLEMINPLQHIPVVSHFYREATGTDIPDVAKIIGGGLTGGIIGAASSMAVSVAEAISGQPLIESAQSMLNGSPDHAPFAASGQVVHAFTPDAGQATLALLESQALQQQVSTSALTATPPAQPTGLETLRNSIVGLPEEHIEAQLNHQLHEKIVGVL